MWKILELEEGYTQNDESLRREHRPLMFVQPASGTRDVNDTRVRTITYRFQWHDKLGVKRFAWRPELGAIKSVGFNFSSLQLWMHPMLLDRHGFHVISS